MSTFALTSIPKPRRSTGDRLKSAASALLLLVATIAALVMLVPTVLGFERYVIVSGSMTGTYDRGSVIYAKAVPVSDLAVGDVITYAPPPGVAPTELVTHRIVTIERDDKGRPLFRTKGDANPGVDPWQFVLEQDTQAKVSGGIPYVGYVFAGLSDRETRMAVIGLPAILIALLTLFRLVRDTRRDMLSARSSGQTG